MREPAANGQLALLLEVTGTPKPGNVDRHRDYPDLRFEHFVAGAVGARDGLGLAADGARVGRSFERAVAGMSRQTGGNTQFGALLLVTPLVAAAARGRTGGADDGAGDGGGGSGEGGPDALAADDVADVVESTTVDDACDFFRAFEHVDVAVEDPPPDMAALDVRRGAAAVDAVRERGIDLAELMARSADRDGVAAEWTNGFERSFAAAGWLLDDDGPVYRRTSRAFLRLLADREDTFVRIRNGEAAAAEATRRARDVLDDGADAEELAEEFVRRDINPGTTADVTAAALFVALERGLEV